MTTENQPTADERLAAVEKSVQWLTEQVKAIQNSDKPKSKQRIAAENRRRKLNKRKAKAIGNA